jgi:hypothetical protein
MYLEGVRVGTRAGKRATPTNGPPRKKFNYAHYKLCMLLPITATARLWMYRSYFQARINLRRDCSQWRDRSEVRFRFLLLELSRAVTFSAWISGVERRYFPLIRLHFTSSLCFRLARRVSCASVCSWRIEVHAKSLLDAEVKDRTYLQAGVDNGSAVSTMRFRTELAACKTEKSDGELVST